MKCNNHPTVLETFAALGLGFDCASKVGILTSFNEIEIKLLFITNFIVKKKVFPRINIFWFINTFMKKV